MFINKDTVKWVYRELLGEIISDERAHEIVVELRTISVGFGIIGLMAAITDLLDNDERKRLS